MGSDPEVPCLSVEIRDKSGSVIKTIERSVSSSSGTFHQHLAQAIKDVQHETNEVLTKIIDDSKASANKNVSMTDDQSDSEEDSSEPHKRAKTIPSPAKKKQKSNS